MKLNIATRLISAVAALALIAGSTASLVQAQSGYGYTVQIENRSDYAIYQIRMSLASDRSWERDLLGTGALPSGYHITLPERFSPGYYDLKLVDEDGDVCVVSNVRVNGNTTWDITNSWLLNCEF
jgi:hypothetical protein